MKQLGKRKVVLWYTAEELALVDAAVARARSRRATWIKTLAFRAAESSALEAMRQERKGE